MFTSRRHSGLVMVMALGLGLAFANDAQVRDDPASQPSLADLAQARFDAANKLFDTAWSYYRQKATSTPFVYFTSHRLLRSELDLSDKRDKRIAAYEHHLSRVKNLQALVAKVQALGRVNTLEATEVSYYRAEAEYWLAQARSSTETGTHHGGTGPVVDQSPQSPGRDS